METRRIDISEIEGNEGQLEGLPRNPRKTTEEAITKLMASIRQDTQMLDMRPLLVYPLPNGKYIAIGGNMRLEALKRMGWKETPCTVIPRETPVETLKRILVKDNASFGEWDWSQLLASWDETELGEWEIQPFEPLDWGDRKQKEEEEKPAEAIRKRKSWRSERQAGESVCDLREQPQVYKRHGGYFLATFRKSEKGVPMSECKQPDMVELFADKAEEAIRGLLAMGNTEGWALVTTPRRRHKDWNFADEVCKRIAAATGMTYIADVAEAKNRHRINPELKLTKEVEEMNVIIYDDILTTGSTVKAMRELLQGKNVVVVIGINNN